MRALLSGYLGEWTQARTPGLGAVKRAKRKLVGDKVKKRRLQVRVVRGFRKGKIMNNLVDHCYVFYIE